MNWFKKSFEPDLKLNRKKYITLVMRLLDLVKKQNNNNNNLKLSRGISQLCLILNVFTCVFCKISFNVLFYSLSSPRIFRGSRMSSLTMTSNFDARSNRFS